MVSDAPWTAVPARRLSSFGLKLRVRIIFLLLGVAALTGPLALIVSLVVAGPSGQVPQVDDPVARLAVRAAVDYASGSTSGVSAAEGVDLAFGARSGRSGLLGQSSPALKSGVLEASVVARRQVVYLGVRPYELVTVELLSSDGSVLTLEVPVYLQGPALAAGISVVPSAPSTQVPLPQLDYLDHPAAVRPSAPVASSVGEWAAAWTSGDAAALKRLTSDTLPGRYVPLGGFELLAFEVVSVLDLSEGSGEQERRFQAVRVRLLMEDASTGAQVTSEYDLRVDAPYSDFPAVTAWGPPGSSPLAAFSNRVAR